MSQKFELKVNKAKDILDKLMTKDIELDEALKLYKDGMKQLNQAQEMLDSAKLEFEQLVKTYDTHN